MKIGLVELWHGVKDICFPPVCLSCNTALAGRQDHPDIHLCRLCATEIRLLHEPLCSQCGRPFPYSAGANHLCGSCLVSNWHFTCARAVIQYERPLARAIRNFKYTGQRNGLSTFAALKSRLPHLDDMMTPDLILPVPLHRKRLQERGFNQAQVLAGFFFPDYKKKIDIISLKRHRATAPQTGLSALQRRKNIKGAFGITGKRVAGKKVLLIDDVFTTGTTVNECARVLMRAGTLEVQVLTLARVVL